MIIVNLFQGLGNQLFQYSFARALSLRHNIDLKFDLTFFDRYSHHRKYGLSHFSTLVEIATNEEIYNFKNGIKKNKISNFFFQHYQPFLPYYKKPFVEEDLSKFDRNLLLINSDTYIHGYFASELFFKDYETIIRNELKLNYLPNDYNNSLIQQITNQNSVCLSIRRGDFVNNPLHDVCNLNYFYDACQLMNKKIQNAIYYIFSDDIEWAKSNFKIKNEHYFVAHNYPDYFEDFRIMQNCHHHVIPNSTFSWWAAWLCNHSDKIVIAPKTWLNSNTIDYSTVIPQEWIKIENHF